MAFIIISSPSGGGKTTICNMLINSETSPVCGNVEFSISTTTRPKRKHEIHGREYFFTNKEEFLKMIQSGEFLEYATVCENYYGTKLSSVSKTKHTLFDIDFQGFRQVKQNSTQEKVVNIFLLPPSLTQLENRLNARGDVQANDIKLRMSNAIEEILHCKEYDYIITNHNIDTTFASVCNILQSSLFNGNLYDGVVNLSQEIKNISLTNIDSFLEKSLTATQKFL